MSAKIIGIDIPWFDELIKLPSLPKNNRSCRIDSLGYAGGGKVSTALVAAAPSQQKKYGRTEPPKAHIVVCLFAKSKHYFASFLSK